MKINHPIPQIMSHLKVDPRGYAIPFFVPIVEGKPDFRFMDQTKQEKCIDHHLCGICGKKLFEYCYFISGPVGYKNHVSSDPAMHRECAEYSLAVCPHMIIHSAQRRSEKVVETFQDPDFGKIAASGQHVMHDKPEILLLIKCTKYKRDKTPLGHALLNYKPVSVEKYIYIDGILHKETS